MFKYLANTIAVLILTSTVYAQRPSLGAIRWDAWTGDSNIVGQQVEKTLSPQKYHYRVPFFGREIDSSRVEIQGAYQWVMDEEIGYAHYAGLNYWAFLYYPPKSGLDKARQLYYKSRKKDLINYCLIIEPWHFNTEITLNQIVTEFKDRSYETVLNGRPLLYLLGYKNIRVQDIDTLRSRTIKAGLQNPYIVELRVDGNLNVLDSLHIDAFGMYATTWIANGVSYNKLAQADMEQWNWTGISKGKKIVPHITTGWDKRPRFEFKTAWDFSETYKDAWVQKAKPEELVQHIQEGMNWINHNPSVAEANTILIYAWNEHDEGGWLCPTLKKYEGKERINALHEAFFQSKATK